MGAVICICQIKAKHSIISNTTHQQYIEELMTSYFYAPVFKSYAGNVKLEIYFRKLIMKVETGDVIKTDIIYCLYRLLIRPRNRSGLIPSCCEET